MYKIIFFLIDCDILQYLQNGKQSSKTITMYKTIFFLLFSVSLFAQESTLKYNSSTDTYILEYVQVNSNGDTTSISFSPPGGVAAANVETWLYQQALGQVRKSLELTSRTVQSDLTRDALAIQYDNIVGVDAFETKFNTTMLASLQGDWNLLNTSNDNTNTATFVNNVVTVGASVGSVTTDAINYQFTVTLGGNDYLFSAAGSNVFRGYVGNTLYILSK